MSNLLKISSSPRSPLSFNERQIIEMRLRGKWTIRKIAAYLGRDHTIISREIKRNLSPSGRYLAKYAQQQAESKSHHTNKKKLDKNFMLGCFVREKLKAGWSPEQIAGRLKKIFPNCSNADTIGHEAIYRYIYESPYGRYLFRYLRRKKRPRRQKRFGRKNKVKILIPERVSIHDRPEIINQRGRVGDWESDSMVFRKQKTGLSVQYERKLMLIKIHRVQDHTAAETTNAWRASIESSAYPDLWLSMTLDNGLEGVEHVKLRDEYGMDTFHCDTYKSWQKGGVENGNGLIRQYLPRSVNLGTISDEQIYMIQENLNNRPRKKLKFQTPNEALQQYLITARSGAWNTRIRAI